MIPVNIFKDLTIKQSKKFFSVNIKIILTNIIQMGVIFLTKRIHTYT